MNRLTKQCVITDKLLYEHIKQSHSNPQTLQPFLKIHKLNIKKERKLD